MLTIRKIKKSDTNNILKWRNSKLVMSFFIDRRPLTKEQHYNWLETKVKAGEVAQFIASEDGVDFASVYFRNIDKQNNKAEFGIFIGEENFLGKGYGKKISRLAINYAFDELKLNKVYARVLKYNKASYNMFLKLGFHKDATLRKDVLINGKYYDVYILSVLENEWRKNEE